MPSNNRTAKILLQYDVDKAGLAKIAQANQAVKRDFDKTGDDLRKSFSGSAQSTSLLAQRLQEGTEKADKLSKKIAEIRDRAKSASEVEFDNLAANLGRTPSGGGNGGGGRLDAIDTAGSRISQIAGGLGQGELANFAGLIGDISSAAKDAPNVLPALKEGILGLGVAAPIAAGALIGLGIGLAIFQKQTEEARASLQDALSAQQAYYDAVATLDEQGAQDRIDQLDRSIAAQTQLATEARAAADSAFAQLSSQFGDAIARTIFAADPAFQQLASTAATAEQELGAMTQEQTRLTQGLEEGVFAANNATEAQDQLTAATERANAAILGSINERVNREIEYYRLTQTGSSEAIQARIDENAIRVQTLEEERAALELLAANGVDTGQNISELNQQITELQRDTQRLGGSILTAAQAREQETAAVKASEEAERNRAQTLRQVAQIQAQIAADNAAQALADQRSQRDFARQRLREDIDFARQQAEAAKQFHEQQAQQIADFQAKQKEAQSETLKTEQDFHEKEAERTKKYLKKIADIERDAKLELGEAAGELDAKAAYAALQQRDKALEDAKESNDEESEANAKARDERLRDIKEQLNDEQRALQQRLAQEAVAFAQQQQQERTALNERRQRENEDRAIRRGDELQDRAARRAAQTAQLAELNASIQQEKSLRKAGQNQILADIQAFVNGAVNLTKNLKNNTASGTPKSIPGKVSLPPTSGGKGGGFNKGGAKGFAEGGIIPAGVGMMAYYEPSRNTPELAMPLTQQNMERFGLGGQSIQLTMHNTFQGVQNMADIERQIEPSMRRLLRRVIGK